MEIESSVHRRIQNRDSSLSQYAVRSETCRGRERPEPDDAFRSPFQIDRDRIVRTKAFRRLMHKTQVFIAPLGDHYLTRLTHTMEVAVIARTVTRALNLNEDLAEAICMGHDLGHAPFGHLGEAALAEMHPGGFRHNRQSVRVVEVLENDGLGLNLTWEVRQGILRHSKSRTGIEGRASPELDTLEAQIAKIADALAYINHDTDDAVRAGIISETDLPPTVVATFGRDRAQWARVMAEDIVRSSWAASGEPPVPPEEPPVIQMSPRVSDAANTLREFLFQRVYEPNSADEQAERARAIIALLYGHFKRRPQLVPEGYSVRGEPPERMALDYVAGMTDSYALRIAEEIQPGIGRGFREIGAPLPLPQAQPC
ncbi:MAG: deoxyguanosinetriphosphate triphosphohydrolase [Dehalococcoidia bacterium]